MNQDLSISIYLLLFHQYEKLYFFGVCYNFYNSLLVYKNGKMQEERGFPDSSSLYRETSKHPRRTYQLIVGLIMQGLHLMDHPRRCF